MENKVSRKASDKRGPGKSETEFKSVSPKVRRACLSGWRKAVKSPWWLSQKTRGPTADSKLRKLFLLLASWCGNCPSQGAPVVGLGSGKRTRSRGGGRGFTSCFPKTLTAQVSRVCPLAHPPRGRLFKYRSAWASQAVDVFFG